MTMAWDRRRPQATEAVEFQVAPAACAVSAQECTYRIVRPTISPHSALKHAAHRAQAACWCALRPTGLELSRARCLQLAMRVTFEAVKEQLRILGHDVPDEVVRAYLDEVDSVVQASRHDGEGDGLQSHGQQVRRAHPGY
jgi:hypothetical protein